MEKHLYYDVPFRAAVMFSNLGAYSNSLKPQPKDREGLRLFAESKAIMTCFDLTNFFILVEFAI